MKPLQPKCTESPQTVINSQAGAPVYRLVGEQWGETEDGVRSTGAGKGQREDRCPGWEMGYIRRGGAGGIY